MRKSVMLTVAVSAALVLSGAAASAAPLSPSSVKKVSSNATGYGAVPKSGGATAFKYVSASFTVPAIPPDGQCTDDYGDADLVVGLGDFTTAGGYGDNSDDIGEQSGVYEACTSANTLLYEAGYEVNGTGYSGGTPPEGAVPVSPGDTIFTSVYYDSSTKEYAYYTHDETTGQTVRVTQACPPGTTCSNNSAEAVVNDPGYAYLDFVQVSFSDIRVTDSAGHQGGLNDAAWNLDQGVENYAPDQSPPYDIGPALTSAGQSYFTLNYAKPS